MGRAVWNALRFAAPPPRVVDWSLFVVVVFQVVSGLVSFTVATPSGWPIFWAHRIAGLSFVVLLAVKLARVRYRLVDRSQWERSTALSVLIGLVAVGALATGIAWVFGADVRLAAWTLLSVHVGFGLVLVPLVAWHLSTRFRRHRRRDFDGRRTILKYSVLLLGAAVTYRAQEFANVTLKTPGSNRRVTGSQPREGSGNASFPITSWVADDPDPIDRSSWTLSVRGAVESPLDVDYSDLTTDATQDALLDCTSGWYTVQRWQGIRVGDLVDAATPHDDVRYVRFVSVTGYRWSVPLDEARDTLLATHVGDELLSHGHGAPLRLVAPGRRGFQWVKWITRIDLRRHSDPAQWLVTLVSGFD